jgi:hypothetical protein
MTPKVKYVDNRRYRDFVVVEETSYFTKKQKNNRLVKKETTIWDRVRDFFRK